jgi:hypothetical protein
LIHNLLLPGVNCVGIKNLLAEARFRNTRVSAQEVNPFEIIHALRNGKNSFTEDKENKNADEESL